MADMLKSPARRAVSLRAVSLGPASARAHGLRRARSLARPPQRDVGALTTAERPPRDPPGSPVEADRARAGLCADCRWARRVPNARGSVFFLCRRAETDPAFPRYPRLPVLACPGYDRVRP